MNMNILFLHGMGGGRTTKMPKKLNQVLSKMNLTKDGEPCTLRVICETYDFDPDVATRQIGQWVETYQPVMVISESMGAIHALGIQGIPHIYLSPALNYDRGVKMAMPLVAIGEMMGFHYHKQRGANNQLIHGDTQVLAKFQPMIQSYKEAIRRNPNPDTSYAYFGDRDEFKLAGIVSIKEYESLFGDSYEVYEGGHVLDVKHAKGVLVPKIAEMLGVDIVKQQRKQKKNN